QDAHRVAAVAGATVTGRQLPRGNATRSQLSQPPRLAHVYHAPLQSHEAGTRQSTQLLVGGLATQVRERGDQLLTHVEARIRRRAKRSIQPFEEQKERL